LKKEKPFNYHPAIDGVRDIVKSLKSGPAIDVAFDPISKRIVLIYENEEVTSNDSGS
jgi:hypothetical protein